MISHDAAGIATFLEPGHQTKLTARTGNDERR
jgi:hypothetical protein